MPVAVKVAIFDEAVDAYKKAIRLEPSMGMWKKIHAELRKHFTRLEIERIKKEAKGSDRPKHLVCPVCDDRFTMPVTAKPGRAHLGMCAGCYGQRETRRTYASGSETWADARTRIGSRGRSKARHGPR